MGTAEWALVVAGITLCWQLLDWSMSLLDKDSARGERRREFLARLRGEKRDRRKTTAQESSANSLEDMAATLRSIHQYLVALIPNPTDPSPDEPPAVSRARDAVLAIEHHVPGVSPSGVVSGTVSAQAGPATTNIQVDVIRKDDPYHPRFGHHTPADFD